MQASRNATGDLVLRLEGRGEADLISEGEGYYAREQTVAADLLPPGYCFVDPCEVGALTDAPILRDDDGSVWWFPNYCIEDWTETLIEKGAVTFAYGGKLE
jgi:hypothetical protein